MEKGEIARQAWALLEPHVSELGYELVEVEFGASGGGGAPVLRIFIDKEGGGISLDDCAAVSNAVSPVLDAEDFFGQNYYLEVSSPGIDRPLRKASDFERFAGEMIRLASHAPSNGRKHFTGILRGIRDGLILVECDGAVCEIHLDNLKKANLKR